MSNSNDNVTLLPVPANSYFVRPGETPVPGEPLPVATSENKLIAINGTFAMCIGGVGVESNTYYYDIPSQTWSDGPTMIAGDYSMTLGVIRKEGIAHVIAVGGKH